jgi:hypothetical protein
MKCDIFTPENQPTQKKAIRRIIELATEVLSAPYNSGIIIVHPGDQETTIGITHAVGKKRAIIRVLIYNQCDLKLRMLAWTRKL